jgi:hypothetical protein
MLRSFEPRRVIVSRLGLICGAGIAVSFISAQAAAAAPCTPTPAVRDGHPLTAAYYDPVGPVMGKVDASGCDIGVYTDSGHTTVVYATVENAKYFGVLTENGGSTDISDSIVQNIGDVPFSGDQHGIGIEWASGSSGSVDNSIVEQYQKNGVVVADSGTSASVTNDTVTGLGQVSFIAQNGVEFIDGATGTVSGNLITDNYYTGCSNQDAKATGCTPYVATGVLLYDVDPSQVNRSNNQYRDDQRNEYLAPTAQVAAHS